MTKNPNPLKLAVLSLIVGLLPIFSVLVAGGIATLNDCALHEGNPNPCLILGVDIGEILYFLGVMGWFMLISIPLGLLGLFVSGIWFVFKCYSKS